MASDAAGPTRTAANNAAADGSGANSPSYSLLQQQTDTVQQLQWHQRHSWLDELSDAHTDNNDNNSSSSSRRVEVIDVYAGYHARGSSSSSSSGGGAAGHDTGTLQVSSLAGQQRKTCECACWTG